MQLHPRENLVNVVKETMKKSNNDITKLFKEIDSYILKSDAKESKKIHELRKRVFYVHASVEQSILFKVLDYLFKSIVPSSMKYSSFTEQDFVKWSIIMGGISDSIADYRFKQKLVYAKKLGAIDEKTFHKYESFNTLRNNLAHVASQKHKQYENEKSYIKSVKLILEVAKLSNHAFDWFDELDNHMNKSRKVELTSDDEVPF